MSPGNLAGLVVAGVVLLLCVANVVLAVFDGGAAAEIALWVFGALIGVAGLVVFARRARS